MAHRQRRAQRETSAGGVVFRRDPGGGGPARFLLRLASAGGGAEDVLLRQCAWRARAGRRDGPGTRARGRRDDVTAVVPVYHPRREARRALKSGYPRDAGFVRLCRSLQGVERLLYQRLVDAVVLDVTAPSAAAAALALPA